MRTNALRHDAVFQRYLDVVNRTLVEVKDRFPYNSLIGSLAEALAGRSLVVEIADRVRKNQNTLIVPGSHVGLEGHLRIWLGGKEEFLREGLRRIGAELRPLFD